MADLYDDDMSLSSEDSYDEDDEMPPIADDCVFMPPDDYDDDDDLEDFPHHYNLGYNDMVQAMETAEVMEDDIYMEALVGLDQDRPVNNIGDEELRAIIVGGLMGAGELLKDGVSADQLDMNLTECAGIKMGNLLNYMEFDAGLVDRFSKDKSALLFDPLFRDIVDYDAATGTFKPKLVNGLDLLYDQIVRSGAAGKRRKDQNEQSKLDKMKDPVNRKRYMISCNMLLEIVNILCRETCKTEVGWQEVQNFFRKIMTSRSGLIYDRYKKLLDLDDLANTTVELNQISTRSLFGRGTVSKALSSDIFNKIQHEHNGKQIVIHLNPEYAKNPGICTYGKEDFDAIDAVIIAQNRQQQWKRRGRSPSNQQKQISKEEKERLELEERRKTFDMPEMHAYVPGDSSQPAVVPPAPRFGDSQKENNQPKPAVDRTSSEDSQPIKRSTPRKGLFGAAAFARMQNGEEEEKEEKRDSESEDEEEKEEDKKENEEVDDDDLSSDGGRPTQQRAYFSDDDENECEAKKRAHEQRLREGEEKRRRALEAQKAKDEAKESVFASASSRGTPAEEKAETTKTKVVEPKERRKEKKTEAPKSAPPNKFANYESEGSDDVKGPIIHASPGPRWDVTVPAETRREKDIRLKGFVTDSVKNQSIGGSDFPPASIVSERTRGATSVSSMVEHSIVSRRHPNARPAIHRHLDRSPAVQEPPRPVLGSTRPERFPLLRSTGTQSQPVDVLLDELMGGAPKDQGPIVDPTTMRDRRALFLSYISINVYLFRDTSGTSKRLWSQLQKELDPSFAMPEAFMGVDWRDQLAAELPKLSVARLPDGDTLFFWNEGPSASLRSSSHFY